MQKQQTKSPSDIIEIVQSIPIGQAQVIDRRTWLQRLRDWLWFRNTIPTYSLRIKFLIEEAPYVRAGSVIITENGLKWFVLARHSLALICESVDDLTKESVDAMEKYSGAAVTISQSFPEGQL